VPTNGAPEAATREVDETAPEDVEAPAALALVPVESGEEEGAQPRKKRTRRGSRGGRRRKRASASDGGPTVADTGADGEPASPEGEADEAARAPAYVPMAEWIDDFDARAERAG
jgi:hypothetical protein